MLFELRDVSLVRGDRRVLDSVSAAIPAGATAIVGPSGAGKSTLLRLLNRLADPDSGAVSYRDRPLDQYDPLALRRQVSLVPQLPALLDGTVGSNLAYAARLAGKEPDPARCLGLAGLDPEFAARDVAKLSVGEQQRAMLARALAQQPEVLLLDEPTSALDPAARDAIEATLAELRRELDISVVLVSHDPEQARRLGEWVVRLERGRVSESGPLRGGPHLSTSIHVSAGQVAASLALVALAAAISFWRRADLERDIGIATVRSFVQLTAIGYAIELIFEADTIWLVFALLAVMVVFGALTARNRAKKVPDAFWPLLIALAVAATTTLGLVVALGVFEATARYLVPVGGMVIGNAMTASAVALNRLGDEMADSRGKIEATLALGATAQEAASPFVRRALRSGMITLVDSTKTTGLIFFPGTMVGMLLAGADPTDAVRLQLILLYALLGSVAIAGLVATALAYRNFFTPAEQLREPDRDIPRRQY